MMNFFIVPKVTLTGQENKDGSILATSQMGSITTYIRSFLNLDVVLKLGNPSNFNRKIFGSFTNNTNLQPVDKINFGPYVVGSVPGDAGTTLVQSINNFPDVWNALENKIGFSTIPGLTYSNSGSYYTDFFKDFGTNELLVDRKLTDIDGDFRTIVNLLTDQIEFANVIILNKTDLVDEKTVGLLSVAIKKLNPGAKIISTQFSKVQLNHVLNTGLFDFEEAQNSAGWQKELEAGTHTPETEEYGISSFVFRSQRPFHPLRLWKYLNEEYPSGIIRAKGLFWLASRPNDALNFSQAGGSSRLERAGVWWASMPFNERIRYQSFLDNQSYIEGKWSKTWGDRLNELVFIGQDLDKDTIIADLRKCLLRNDEQYLFDKKIKFNDPFPVNL
jgi:G3E family GTPase